MDSVFDPENLRNEIVWKRYGAHNDSKRFGRVHGLFYDLRHTYATWSLAAGIDIFTLARRMGTSVKMIDRTYGHLVAGADVYERELLDAFDARETERVGRAVDALGGRDAA
jgi:integrase